ncbi:probable serine/threonine-protein kinase SIS8 [Diospyros lotus]|uniref:probable serine/threonine-protein kinase SIS8 n=1 Tax=Diospyros lotus TaxID=55363 RepID=UPI00224FB570|nr:probable serine/threonine-protein kinase SIS8 [Diospyros lotus]
MSRMKHLLRKLHIGGGFNDHDHHHHHRLATDARPLADPPPPQTTSPTPASASASASSSSLAACAPALARAGAADLAADSVDFNFFEEEFQMQLALAISVSDPDARDDPETAQIKAAKQISLGCAASETLVESLSLRYWSYNFLNYDEKVMDGFYDVYAITSNSGMQGKIPPLLDLQAISVSDKVDYEVILVDRAVDPALHQLEETVYAMSLELQLLEQVPIISHLVQKIALLVVDRMGGAVCDAEEMMKKWTFRSHELRNSLNSIILPLSYLDVGLSRHRALLFKVLADRINLPCMLVKGSYYTGTDEGAVNLIKFDDGSEYIIDLMGAPGTLIPAEVPSDHLQSTVSNIRSGTSSSETIKDFCPVLEKGIGTGVVSHDLGQVAKVGTSSSVEVSFSGIQSKGNVQNLHEENQTKKFENDFNELLPLLCKSHEDLSGTSRKASDARKMKVEDVSKYVISASKNPEFAQKLHEVLLESDTVQAPDLFSNRNPYILGDMEMLVKMNLLNEEKVDAGHQIFQEMFLSSNEQSLIPSHVAHPFDDDHYDRKQQHPAEHVVEEQLQSASRVVVNSGQSLSSDSTSEGFVLVTTKEMDQTDAGLELAPIDPSRMVVRASYGEESEESTRPSLGNIETAKVSFDRLMETTNGGSPLAFNTQNERINPSLGDVSGWEISWEDLQIGERIGIGSSGEVYRADWNGTEVAVKKFMDQDISGDALAQFKCEVEIMLRLRHPNVVLFMAAVTRPPNLSILTEYLPRGSLFKLLHRPNNQLDEKRRMRMALDVAKGMNYLHVSHPTIVHRDLKTPNLLVDKNWVVKVCDFGLSRLKHHTFLSSQSTAGTPEWMAPEVLRNEPANEKCDVYSFGVILWELATLRVPWSGMNSMQVVGAVGFQNRHLAIPENIDPTAAQIITDCWHPDPESRPSFGELISRLRRLQHLQRPAVGGTPTPSN